MSVFCCELEQTTMNRRIVAIFGNKKVIANRLEDDSAASLTIDDDGNITFSQPPAGTVSQTAFVEVNNIMPAQLNSVAPFVKEFLDRVFAI